MALPVYRWGMGEESAAQMDGFWAQKFLNKGPFGRFCLSMCGFG